MRNRLSIFSRLWLPFLLLFFFAVSPAFAKKPQVIMKTQGGEIVAVFDGPSCETTVRTIFHGKNVEDFRSQSGIATRLMNNVTYFLHRQCQQMTLVTAKGKVKDRFVYSGLAESGTGWAIKERGAVRSTGLLAGDGSEEDSDAGAKKKFQDNKDFLPFSELLKQMEGKPHLCINYEKSSNTCVSAIHLENSSPDGGSATSRSQQDEQGSLALISYDVSNKSGFLCSDPNKALVKIIEGDMSAEARKEYSDMLTERIVANGNEVCMGYLMFGDEIMTESFNGNGQKIGDTSTVQVAKNEPSLRLEK